MILSLGVVAGGAVAVAGMSTDAVSNDVALIWAGILSVAAMLLALIASPDGGDEGTRWWSMIRMLWDYLWDLRDRQRVAIALAKGGAMMHARTIDLRDPATWEFSGFSQNGEDGILDVLRRQLRAGNRYFVEIGSADGIENNTGWLVVAERYGGLMIEGSARLAARANRSVIPYSIGADCMSLFVGRDNVDRILERMEVKDPDVFSLDIDGIDYYVADALMRGGIRPRIFVVEYNSVFGPERSCTIEYQDSFVFKRAHATHLYYGVSLAAWRRFFARHGYRFVTVERNGVNAFFVDPAHFDAGFLDGVRGTEFAENRYQAKKFRLEHADQFQLIADRVLVEVEKSG